MAEPKNETVVTPDPKTGEYLITIKEFDKMGKSTNISVALPTTSDFKMWSLMQQAVFLKKGTWEKQSLYEIVLAIAYAQNLGVDIMQGDVYPVGEGRLSLSNKARIKLALATGMVQGIQVEFKKLAEKLPEELDKCVLYPGMDIECKVTVTVKGWQHPIVRTAKLSRWYKEKNVNWRDNPEHMLELNTTAHACEMVAPGATYDDEAPTPPILEQNVTSNARNLRTEASQKDDFDTNSLREVVEERKANAEQFIKGAHNG